MNSCNPPTCSEECLLAFSHLSVGCRWELVDYMDSTIPDDGSYPSNSMRLIMESCGLAYCQGGTCTNALAPYIPGTTTRLSDNLTDTQPAIDFPTDPQHNPCQSFALSFQKDVGLPGFCSNDTFCRNLDIGAYVQLTDVYDYPWQAPCHPPSCDTKCLQAFIQLDVLCRWEIVEWEKTRNTLLAAGGSIGQYFQPVMDACLLDYCQEKTGPCANESIVNYKPNLNTGRYQGNRHDI